MDKPNTNTTANTTTDNRPARRPMRRGGRPGGRTERPKPEFAHKVVDVRRVTRVMAGGRRFSFSVTLIAGDKKGRVGVGIGKAGDTSLAIDKAMNDAKKNMILVPLSKEMMILHETEAKLDGTEVIIKPSKGKGLVAGSSIRTVLDLAGVRDVNAKILSRSKNKLNNARVAILALKKLKAS